MAEIPRLNGVIRALEQGKTAFVGFGSVDIETASALGASNLDGVAFEMEHAPMSAPALRDALQYMLDRRQILDSGTLAPKVTPLPSVRTVCQSTGVLLPDEKVNVPPRSASWIDADEPVVDTGAGEEFAKMETFGL